MFAIGWIALLLRGGSTFYGSDPLGGVISGVARSLILRSLPWASSNSLSVKFPSLHESSWEVASAQLL